MTQRLWHTFPDRATRFGAQLDCVSKKQDKRFVQSSSSCFNGPPLASWIKELRFKVDVSLCDTWAAARWQQGPCRWRPGFLTTCLIFINMTWTLWRCLPVQCFRYVRLNKSVYRQNTCGSISTWNHLNNGCRGWWEVQGSACTLSCISAASLRSRQVCADQRGVGLITDLCHRRLSDRRGEAGLSLGLSRTFRLTGVHQRNRFRLHHGSHCLIKTQQSLKECISPASF